MCMWQARIANGVEIIHAIYLMVPAFIIIAGIKMHMGFFVDNKYENASFLFSAINKENGFFSGSRLYLQKLLFL